MNIKQIINNLSVGATKLLIDILIAIIVLVVGFRIIKWLENKMKKENRLSKLDPNAKGFVVSFIVVTLKILLIIMVLMIVGVPMASLVTIIGSCAVAIGLALQGGLSNIAGGLMILLFKPFVVGDYILVDSLEGRVKSITMFYTTIVSVDNKTIQLPNGNLSNSNIVNFTHCKTRRVDLKISVSYNSDISKVKKIINDVIDGHQYVLKNESVVVRLLEHSDNALVFAVRVWCNREDYWDLYFDLMEEIKEALDKNKIEIPYQQVDVHMKK